MTVWKSVWDEGFIYRRLFDNKTEQLLGEVREDHSPVKDSRLYTAVDCRQIPYTHLGEFGSVDAAELAVVAAVTGKTQNRRRKNGLTQDPNSPRHNGDAIR